VEQELLEQQLLLNWQKHFLVKKILILESGKELPADDPRTPLVQVKNINDIVTFVPTAIGQAPKSEGNSATWQVDTSEPLFHDTRNYAANHPGGGPSISGSFHGNAPPAFWNWLATTTGNSKFNYSNVINVLKPYENVRTSDSNATERGRTGPIQVTFMDNYNDTLMNPISDMVSSLFGVARGQDYATAAGNIGVWPTQRSLNHNCTRSSGPGDCVRQSSYSTILKQMIASGNYSIEILYEARISHVLFREKKKAGVTTIEATGVQFILNGRYEREATAKEEVVLSLGNLRGSAVVLQKSGYGDPEDIERLGIELVYNNTQVGVGITDHGFTFFGFFCPNISAGVPLEIPRASHVAFFNLFSSTPSSDWPNMELAYQLVPPENFLPFYNASAGGAVLLFVPAQLYGTSGANGKIEALALDSGTNPFVSFDFQLFNWLPLALTIQAVRAQMATSFPQCSPVLPAATVGNSVEDNLGFLMSSGGGYYHSVGGAAFGKVLNSDFTVKGVKYLRVCDLSVLPAPPPNHPSVTALTLGLICAQEIIQTYNNN
jgi:choline dehydrogenase-like flavoprotein